MSFGIKFDIPNSARFFTPFLRLPPEIRHQIWEAAVLQPGMHWLRLHSQAEPLYPPGHVALANVAEDDSDNDALPSFSHERVPLRLRKATLEPRYPTPQADISNYVSVNRTVSILSATCSESRNVMKRLTNLPGVVKFKNGRVISFAPANDVVCLEYLTPTLFKTGGRLKLPIRCKELAKIRRVAVTYCHQWDPDSNTYLCSHCGNYHSTSRRRVHPVHLYEFIARHLPNLEAFYLVDYLILRKPRPVESEDCEMMDVDTEMVVAQKPWPSTCPDKSRARSEIDPRIYRSADRVFVEANPDDWTVKSSVFDTISWVRKRFVQYATKSKLSTHKRPKSVKFGVLACEWVYDREEISMTNPYSTAKTSQSKRRKLSRPNDASRGRIPLPSGATIRPAMEAETLPTPPLPVPWGTQASFIFGQNMHYDFDFSSAPSTDV
ncbi:hypothetical protein CkaCkLH20_07996 [Colletotrichum karsti]|uniref:2EXR domain-containing protein n=1 Tax=Colletotrichum karsti TaxID=1095194 RepID=A0A9P6HZF6_9PEZI|nr:uncharacterized protein CkaCkLH20_07996 [Colletotrichum karsti]KAF9874433.1 hypothetical protein CkaCkLH20_07996 [Colletotrichum karsti]